MGFLKAIGVWLLGIILKGLGKKIEDDKRVLAEKERDQALAREEVVKQNWDLENQVEEAKEQAKKDAEAQKETRSESDPFGNKAWNNDASGGEK